MPENDANKVRPVEGLQNIGALNRVNRRDERKQRHPGQQHAPMPQDPAEDDLAIEDMIDPDDEHSIDYRA
jgi:hypothetical protein